jgi:tripartite-type tricarboxylate transporter receptor subunit TctC
LRQPQALEVNPMVLVKTVPEFIAYAKARPGKINMATDGLGGAAQVYGDLFKAIGCK